MSNNEEERAELDLSLSSIAMSITAAIFHGMIEVIKIYTEKEMSNTDYLHYLITCFNGRFGWIPFIDHLHDGIDQNKDRHSN